MPQYLILTVKKSVNSSDHMMHFLVLDLSPLSRLNLSNKHESLIVVIPCFEWVCSYWPTSTSVLKSWRVDIKKTECGMCTQPCRPGSFKLPISTSIISVKVSRVLSDIQSLTSSPSLAHPNLNNCWMQKHSAVT